MKNRLFYALAAMAIGCNVFAGELLAFPKVSEWQSLKLETVEQVHKKALVALRIALGDAGSQNLVKLLAKKYPGYLVVGGCSGTFKKAGQIDVGLSLVDAHLTKAFFAVAWDDDKGGFTSIDQLVAQDISLNEHGMLRSDPSIECLAWTQVERLKAGYSRVTDYTSGENLHPVSKFDAICTVPADAVEAHLCYDFDPKRGKFVNIGGWTND